MNTLKANLAKRHSLSIGQDFRSGSNRSWKVERIDASTFALIHYAHCMLLWEEDEFQRPDVIYMSTGHGTVSDQGGMNTAFRVLGLPLYFSRVGGAGIIDPLPSGRF